MDARSSRKRRAPARIGAARALLVTCALLVTTLVSAPAAHSDAIGLESGRFSALQVFDVLRTPPYPSCTAGVPDSFTVEVSSGLTSPLPHSDATDGVVDLGSGYLSVFASGDAAYPWGIKYFTSTGQELRLNVTTSAWETEPGGGWTADHEVFTAAGQIFGASDRGFLHVSSGNDFGTFISTRGALVPGQVVTYVPDTGLNTCTSALDVLPGYPVPGDVALGTFSALKTDLPVLVVPIFPPSTDADLTTLTLSRGTLSPSFDPGTTAFAASVPFSVDSVTVTPWTSHGGALTRVNGVLVARGVPSAAVPLAAGAVTTITTVVTATDSTTTRSYVVRVTRAAGVPRVTTEPATHLSESSATLRATVEPNGADATTRFCYGTAADLSGCTSVVATGTSAVVTGLAARTRFYFRATARNDAGEGVGAIRSFTTSAAASTPTPAATPTPDPSATPTPDPSSTPRAPAEPVDPLPGTGAAPVGPGLLGLGLVLAGGSLVLVGRRRKLAR